MKKIRLLLLTLTAVVSFSACEDFLVEEPQSVLTQDGFYTTPTRINQGIIGCYAGMTNILNDEWMYTELRSDNTCITSTGSSSSTRQYLTSFAHFSLIPSEPKLVDYWYNTFQNISNINTVLPSVLDNSYIELESLRAQYEGELRFMRGYHYLNMVNLFGEMFIVDKLVGPIEAKTIQRSPVDDVYDQLIIPDLKLAAELAPESYQKSDLGRITKWAAKAMLAKAYMMRGGDANRALAKPLLEEVLNESGHELESNFADVFSTSNEMNNEIIFAVRYKGGSLGIGSPFWEYFAPEGSANRILKVGTPDGNNNPTLEIRALLDSLSPARGLDSYAIYRRSSTRLFPYILKFQDPNISQALQAENDWIVLRYADVALLYAEIQAQDGGFALAHEKVNEVRNRVGLDPMDPFTSEKMALDSIYMERRLELAFENHRWFDLLRMEEAYGEDNKAMEILIEHTFHTDSILYSAFNPLPVPDESNYTKDRLLLPIPQTEIDTNNEMVIPQNAGY